MRILHTSDWHLGRSLHGADLGRAQEEFLDHLVAVVAEESVDVVAIAGDIFDRAIPPVQSIRLLEDSLSRIRAAGAQIVAISGNHDSPTRLGFGASLMAVGGVHLRTSPAAVASPVVIDDVAFYCLPFLEPYAVSEALPADPNDETTVLGRTHDAVIQRAVACARADIETKKHPHVVLLAHGWVIGGTASDSERDVTVGGAGTISASHFVGLDYVALGHLHGQQSLDDHLRYSGSPLPYSFSEAEHTKGSWLVTVGSAGVSSVESVAAPIHRRLVVLTGPVETLMTSSEYSSAESAYVSVIATDDARPIDAMDRLRARFPHILAFRWAPCSPETDGRSYAERVHGRGDVELALDFVAYVRNEASEAERDLVTAAVEAVTISADAG